VSTPSIKYQSSLPVQPNTNHDVGPPSNGPTAPRHHRFLPTSLLSSSVVWLPCNSLLVSNNTVATHDTHLCAGSWHGCPLSRCLRTINDNSAHAQHGGDTASCLSHCNSVGVCEADVDRKWSTHGPSHLRMIALSRLFFVQNQKALGECVAASLLLVGDQHLCVRNVQVAGSVVPSAVMGVKK
jgi:hypothetical protein